MWPPPTKYIVTPCVEREWEGDGNSSSNRKLEYLSSWLPASVITAPSIARVERIIVVGYSTLHLVITFTPFYFHDLEYACFYAM